MHIYCRPGEPAQAWGLMCPAVGPCAPVSTRGSTSLLLRPGTALIAPSSFLPGPSFAASPAWLALHAPPAGPQRGRPLLPRPLGGVGGEAQVQGGERWVGSRSGATGAPVERECCGESLGRQVGCQSWHSTADRQPSGSLNRVGHARLQPASLGCPGFAFLKQSMYRFSVKNVVVLFLCSAGHHLHPRHLLRHV